MSKQIDPGEVLPPETREALQEGIAEFVAQLVPKFRERGVDFVGMESMCTSELIKRVNDEIVPQLRQQIVGLN